MNLWFIFLMFLVVQAAINCPGICNCRENQVACPRGLPSPENIPNDTKTLILGQITPYEFFGGLSNSLNQLEHLTLSSCSLHNFDNITFDQFTKLETLDISYNLLTELTEEIFNHTTLKVLDISQNSIQGIHGSPFRTLTSLQILNLSGNAIPIIPENTFSGLSALITLDLSKNNITEIDKSFDPLKNLQQLNLSKNRIVTLSENCFSNLQKLQQLDISWNRLSYVSPTTLQALPSLARLMLAGNSGLGLSGTKDTALLVGTGKRLQTLDASKTGLEHVPAALTHSVRTLRLAGNSIKYVECGDLDSYPLLQLLDLTSNYIQEIEEDSLGRLEMLVILYLTDNKLRGVPRSLPDGLKILHLEFNRIEQIVSGDLIGLPKLEVLLLNDNDIKVVQEGAFNQVTSLVTLDLSRNPISILPVGTLVGPTHLQVLRLSSLNVDPLVDVDVEDGSFPLASPEHLVRLDLSNSPGLTRQLLSDKAVLSAFRELQELNLRNTSLVYLRNDLLHFMPQLRDLHVTGNRLNCSGLLWLTLWMRVQDQPEHREVICFSPPELYGTPLIDLQDNDMEITTTIQPLTLPLTAVMEAPTEKNVSISLVTNETWNEMSSGVTTVNSVTTEFQNRSDVSANDSHFYKGIENPVLVVESKTTLSDGHIATDDRLTSQPSNYIAITTSIPTSTKTTSRDELKTSKDEFKTSRDELKTSRDELKTSRDELKASRDELKASRDELKASRDELKASRDELKPSRDELKTSSDEFKTSRDELKASKDELKTSRDELRPSRDELKASRDELKTSRDELRPSRDELKASRDELKTSSDELRPSRDELKASRDELKTNRDELRPSRDELKASRDELKTNRDELRPSRDELKASRDELNGTLNNPTLSTSTLVTEDMKSEQVPDNATLLQMSMYSLRRGSDSSSPDLDTPTLHPGMLIVLGAVLGTLIVFIILISHVRKKRKRLILGDYCSDFSHQQEDNIEVNNLPGFSELW